MEDETTERAAKAAYNTWRRHYDHITQWHELNPQAQVLWINVAHAALASVREPRQPIPVGLCGNRQDHEPHFHESTGLGPFYCHADQDKRVPYAMERKNR